MRQTGMGVDLTSVDRDGGEEETLTARYVIGCDGARSVVRKLANIRLSGYNYDELFLGVQCRVKRPFYATPHFRFICDPDRPGGEMPAPGGHYRFEFMLKEGEVDGIEEPENLWKILAERGVGPEDVEIQGSWVYRFQARQADRWRDDRLLLAGDAAHLMPPFIGQGITSAFRDVSNLSWKLAAVLRGHANENLLDTYESERAPHVKALTDEAVKVGRLVVPSNRRVASVTTGSLRLLTRIPGVTSLLSRVATKPMAIGPGFRRESRASWSGHLMPRVQVTCPGSRELRPIDEALGAGFAILGLDLDPWTELGADCARAWEAVEPRCLRVRPISRSVEEGEIGDPVNELYDWFTANGASIVVIRPDRYIYAVGNPGDEALMPPPGQLTKDGGRQVEAVVAAG
jgi:3-(3-hydroxy-phenyl)propionate hydroxylase